jgi:hypothetical protein
MQQHYPEALNQRHWRPLGWRKEFDQITVSCERALCIYIGGISLKYVLSVVIMMRNTRVLRSDFSYGPLGIIVHLDATETTIAGIVAAGTTRAAEVARAFGTTEKDA